MISTLRRLAVFSSFGLAFWQVMLWASWALGACGCTGLAARLTHPHNTHGYLQQRTEEWKKWMAEGRQPDALYFGSSLVMNGVVPGLVDSLRAADSGVALSFSWASQGQNLFHIPHLLRAALAEVSSETVYIGLSPSAWGHAPEAPPETALNWITQNTFWQRPAWRGASFQMAWQAASPHALLLAGQRAVASAIVEVPLPLPSRGTKSQYIGQGHVTRHDAMPSGANISPRAAADFPDGWCDAVVAIEELAAERGAEVVWLVMPMAAPVAWSMPDCLTGRTIIRGDLWPEASYGPHYADGLHMNASGARLFTHWLHSRR